MTTRRDVLKGAVALTLPATTALPALASETDPVIAAYRAWKAAWDAWGNAIDRDERVVIALMERTAEAFETLVTTEATTHEGIALKIQAIQIDSDKGATWAEEIHNTALDFVLADLRRIGGRST